MRSTEPHTHSNLDKAKYLRYIVSFNSCWSIEALSDANCQSCVEEGDLETSMHLFLHCPDFARLRSNILAVILSAVSIKARISVCRQNQMEHLALIKVSTDSNL